MPERFVMSAVGKCAYFCCKEFLLNVCVGGGAHYPGKFARRRRRNCVLLRFRTSI